MAEAAAVPADVVNAGMKAFEDAYNANDMAACGNCYSAECSVTVNGGVEKGGPFTGKTNTDVAGFLGALRNEMGGTNIKFTVTKVEATKPPAPAHFTRPPRPTRSIHESSSFLPR